MYFGPGRFSSSMAKEQTIEESGELFYDAVSYITYKNTQRVVPKTTKKRPFSGHFGINRILHRIKEGFM